MVPRPSLQSTWEVLQTLASAGLPPSFRVASAVTIILTVVTAAMTAATLLILAVLMVLKPIERRFFKRPNEALVSLIVPRGEGANTC